MDDTVYILDFRRRWHLLKDGSTPQEGQEQTIDENDGADDADRVEEVEIDEDFSGRAQKVPIDSF